MVEENKKPPSYKFNLYLDTSVLLSFTEADDDSISELLRICKEKNYPLDITPFYYYGSS